MNFLQLLFSLFGGGGGAVAKRAATAVAQQLFRSGRRPRGVPVGTGARPIRTQADLTRALRGQADEDKPKKPETDPAESGFNMVQVVSSNVHSIGYQMATGTLAVRYLAPKLISAGGGLRLGGKTNAPGPLYHYFDVSPKLWKSFESAGSKGKWVWDNLRIRGTIAGHKYDYRLVTGTVAPSGVQVRYIPRRASGKGFMSRSRFLDGKRAKSTFATQRFAKVSKGREYNRGR